MKEKTYNIYRHGDTLGARRGWYFPLEYFTASILPEGIPPIKRLAEYLRDKPIDSHVISPIRRCRETASIVTKEVGVKPRSDWRLADRLPIEPLFILKWRVKSFLRDMEKSEDENILICTHKAHIAVMAHILTGKALSGLGDKSLYKPGTLTMIKGNKEEIKDFN